MKSIFCSLVALLLVAPGIVWGQEVKVLELFEVEGNKGGEGMVTLKLPRPVALSKAEFTFKYINEKKKDQKRLGKYTTSSITLSNSDFEGDERLTRRLEKIPRESRKPVELTIEVGRYSSSADSISSLTFGLDNFSKKAFDAPEQFLLQSLKLYAIDTADTSFQWFSDSIASETRRRETKRLELSNIKLSKERRYGFLGYRKTSVGVIAKLLLFNIGDANSLAGMRPKQDECPDMGITYDGNVQVGGEIGPDLEIEDMNKGEDSILIEFTTSFSQEEYKIDRVETCQSASIVLLFKVEPKPLLVGPKNDFERYTTKITEETPFSVEVKNEKACPCGDKGGEAELVYTLPTYLIEVSKVQVMYREGIEKKEQLIDTLLVPLPGGPTRLSGLLKYDSLFDPKSLDTAKFERVDSSSRLVFSRKDVDKTTKDIELVRVIPVKSIKAKRRKGPEIHVEPYSGNLIKLADDAEGDLRLTAGDYIVEFDLGDTVYRKPVGVQPGGKCDDKEIIVWRGETVELAELSHPGSAILYDTAGIQAEYVLLSTNKEELESFELENHYKFTTDRKISLNWLEGNAFNPVLRQQVAPENGNKDAGLNITVNKTAKTVGLYGGTVIVLRTEEAKKLSVASTPYIGEGETKVALYARYFSIEEQ